MDGSQCLEQRVLNGAHGNWDAELQMWFEDQHTGHSISECVQALSAAMGRPWTVCA